MFLSLIRKPYQRCLTRQIDIKVIVKMKKIAILGQGQLATMLIESADNLALEIKAFPLPAINQNGLTDQDENLRDRDSGIAKGTEMSSNCGPNKNRRRRSFSIYKP